MDLLTYADAARILCVPIGTLYALVSRHSIPHVRIGPRLVRFSRDELARWVDARRVPASGPHAAGMPGAAHGP
jgi:excisionase family DNA binding protein